MKVILLLTGDELIHHCRRLGTLFLLSILLVKLRLRNITLPLLLPLGLTLPLHSHALPLKTFIMSFAKSWNLYCYWPWWVAPSRTCLLSALLDVYDLLWASRAFPFFFLLLLHYSYSILFPKASLVFLLVYGQVLFWQFPTGFMLVFAVRLCFKWQDTWIHSSQFIFCKGRSTTRLNSHLYFDLLSRYHQCGCFAGLQFDFAKCFDSIPYSVIWSTLKHYGCDPDFVTKYAYVRAYFTLFPLCGLYRFFWSATNGLLQGDPLSVVILNCAFCPLVQKLSTIGDLSVYAFADDLTVVPSSWETLSDAYVVLCQFCASTDLHLNLSKCQLWNKGVPYGQYPSDFDQFAFCFYPFLLGSPVDIGVLYDDSLL